MVWLLFAANVYALVIALGRGRLPAYACWLAFGVISCMVYNPWSQWRFVAMALIGFALRMWLSIECVRLILPQSHADLLSLLLAAGCIGALLFLSVAYLIDRDYSPGVMLAIYLWIGSLGWFWTIIGAAWLYAPVSRDLRLKFVVVIGMESLVLAIARLSSGNWAWWQNSAIVLRAALIAASGYLLQRFENPYRREYR